MGPDLRFAHELADAADAITLARFRALDLRVETKPDLTPVSEADRAAEEAIRALVAERRPGESVFGEELGDDGGDVRWIVDPIDGTRNYVRGVPVWGTLIALERDGVVDAGVVSAPALGRRWWATRGEGAFAGERRAHPRVGGRADRGRRRLDDLRAGDARRLGPARRDGLGRAAPSATSGSTASSPRARSTSRPTSELQLWDYAAVQLIVEEAGGRCTTFDGSATAPGKSFLAANAAIHAAASRCSADLEVRLLRAGLGARPPARQGSAPCAKTACS